MSWGDIPATKVAKIQCHIKRAFLINSVSSVWEGSYGASLGIVEVGIFGVFPSILDWMNDMFG